MNTRLYDFLSSVLSGHECDFGKNDEAFLRQFGIKRLTPLRDTVDDSLEFRNTLYDSLQRKAGHIGCHDSAMQDFLCEKDGVIFAVFVYCGVWAVGHDFLEDGVLMTAGDVMDNFMEDEVGYDPTDFHKFDLYGTGYMVTADSND